MPADIGAKARATRRRERLLARLPDLCRILRGSLVAFYRRCGRANCRCSRPGEPGHGPAYRLTVSGTRRKIAQVYVPVRETRRVRQWLRNFHTARRILEEICRVNRELLHAGILFEDEGDARKR